MQDTITASGVAKSRRSTALKAGGALALAVTLLFGGGSLAGWYESKQIAPAATEITGGALDLTMSGEGWTYRGAPITEAELSTTPLVPGDTLTYTGTAGVGITGDLAAELKFTAASTGDLLTSGVADVVWSVDGGTATLELDASNDGDSIPVTWTLAMAPIGDPAYISGDEGELKSLTLDDVTVELKQVAK